MTRSPLLALTLAALASGAAAIATEGQPDETCRTVTFLRGGGVVESTARLSSFRAPPTKETARPQPPVNARAASDRPGDEIAEGGRDGSSSFIDPTGRAVTIVSTAEGCNIIVDERARKQD